jgi:uncharacterized protein HemY
MMHSFLNDLNAIYIVLVLFVSLLIALGIGYRIGLKKQNRIIKTQNYCRRSLGYWL